MPKLLVLILSVPCAALLAGAYGVLHNQISFTVSPEYFTHFKFQQFGMQHFYDRLGASFIGWAASWWVGAVTALVLTPFTLGIKDSKQTARILMRAFALIIACALAFGLCALLWAFYFVDANFAPQYQVPDGVNDRAAFLRAGIMHNHSYLGAFFGMVVGAWSIRQYKHVVQEAVIAPRDE